MPAELHSVARELGDDLGPVVDAFLAERPAVLLGLGEPTHGIAAFTSLRNEMLVHLVARGFRSVALETDIVAASIVDEYVAGGTADLDEVLATGFSHGFGAVPGNRELLEWLRDHNAAQAPADQVRFHGFDAPVEYSGAPSPGTFLRFVVEALPPDVGLPPGTGELDQLLGDDADWTAPDAMYDAAASIGGTDRARILGSIADGLAAALPPDAQWEVSAHARIAQGLLRYHAAMASSAPDRIGQLLGVRAEMMADNLRDIVARERRHGPTLVFAHNSHLHRGDSALPGEARWAAAGALLARDLGDEYVVIATDANPSAPAGTLQAMVAEATVRRALYPSDALRSALPGSVTAGPPIVPGHLPLSPADLSGTDAVVFIADTDGHRHRYW
ncbi:MULTISPECIES: erythromycin esterase family protein [Nocardiaceae]|uniref:Erythromycin esterase-like protein n=1 Tax=Rhodococcoides corynebacterioides TaxID=53972 RepID=A0ABS2KU75_9NOCA|nr:MULTISPECIES: erythromycin esterase family protein [Rhodococcus]MBM7415500.1 erythromycin esterase-like protein [Rhodococcus corynebacterioides]MBP1117962.1 erythromycin esterase-like protein [Rhodococcus sp. PvP016]